MSLHYLSGIGKPRKTKAERKEARKKIVNKFKEAVKNPKKLVAKVAIAPARAAFLLAISLNLVKLAKRMEQAYKKDKEKVLKFWSKFGGEPDKLKQAIEKGSKSKLNGDLGVVAASTVALATPLIIAAVKLFSELKSDKAGDTDKDTPVLDALKDSIADEPTVNKEVVSADDENKPFYKNSYIIGGGILLIGAGIYFATKKK